MSQHQSPGGVPETSQPADATQEVAAAVTGLDGLESQPTAQHVAMFERVHGALTGALAAIDGV